MSSLYRIAILVGSLGDARALLERLGAIDEPAPLASTHFECPGSSDWRVDVYVADQLDALAIIAALDLTPGPRIWLEAVPDENWVTVSQAALPPVRAGDFIIHGSHDRAAVGHALRAIEIDAGEAFGTAHHSTTEGCLIAIAAIARLRSPPRRILDLGCGSGVLAIAAAKALPEARITASDIDPTAVDVARGNARLNGVGQRLQIVEATGLAHPALRAKRFDLVIANILAGPLIQLAPQLARAVEPGGRVILSGLLAEQAREVLGNYAMAGFGLTRKLLLSGWATLVLTRRHSP